MVSLLTAAATRFRVLASRGLGRVGVGEESFLLFLAVVVGMITATAAVGFHELILWIRYQLYTRPGEEALYRTNLWLLILWPALGGLAVGLIARYLVRGREGHGVVDVIESVVRTSGFVKPFKAIEKIITSALTIGTGGSTGAEGPIVQIGAAISGGVGSVFRVQRHQMPLLIGCGCAAGISAIFNAPLGGVLFTLEVILLDFSIRTFTPVVVASVVANITTRAIFDALEGFRGADAAHASYGAIFARPQFVWPDQTTLAWGLAGNFVLLGLLCGLAGVTLTLMLQYSEKRFDTLKWLGPFRPALGGALVGVLGVVFVMIFGWVMFGQPKPFSFGTYPMPAFFGDGYGVISVLTGKDWYTALPITKALFLLLALIVCKIVATCLTLASGGSGGVIAPALFLGATIGGALGLGLRATGYFPETGPEVYALVGMGAVLSAVVHAPLASILILFELTNDYKIMLAAMLAAVVATAFARLICPDSVYTLALRHRGIQLGRSTDSSILRRLNVETCTLEPAAVLQPGDPFQRVLDLIEQMNTNHFVVIDRRGNYCGMVVSEDINVALMRREAVPLIIVGEVMRTDVPLVNNTDDLAAVLDIFARHDVSHLPVQLNSAPGKVIGLISRVGLMRRYQAGLQE
jgi:CIC family chloride channel protein